MSSYMARRVLSCCLSAGFFELVIAALGSQMNYFTVMMYIRLREEDRWA